MKKLGILTIGSLLLGQTAGAASWSAISVTAAPQDTPKVVAAGDRLMSTAAGKEFTGRLLLQQTIADGANPGTHAWVPIYKSAADREAFVQKLQADPGWTAFLTDVNKLTQPNGTVMYRTMKSWGDVVDTDMVWMNYAFDVSDPAAFVAALETFRASPTGKAHTGQVHLSGVIAGGMSPVSHVISVGYASEAEMEAWVDKRSGTKDWADYIAASRRSAEFLGGSMARTIKAWGPATTADLTK